jgi:hypothetical protein
MPEEKAPAPNGIDPKFFNEVSQFAHFFAAATVYLTIFLVLLAGHWYTPRRLLLWVIPGVALAAFKEFWYDKHDENAETRGSDLEDFSFYVLGIVYGVSVALILAARILSF